MKYIYILVFVFAQVFVSCDDILDVNDELSEAGALNKETMFSSKENIEGVVGGVYGKFAAERYNGGNFFEMTSAHTPYFANGGGRGKDFSRFNIPPTQKNMGDMWIAIYQTVDHANHLIKNLNELVPDLSTTPRNLGQGCFLRALIYFDLLRVWGEVPLRTEPAIGETVFLPKSSKQEIYDQIIGDFTLAAELLPTERGEVIDGLVYEAGRPLSYAANGYLAKVYMNMATESGLSGSSAEYWNLAYTNAKLVEMSGRYELVNTYEELFREGNENSIESIFELQYTAAGTTARSGGHSGMCGPNRSEWNTRTNGGNLRLTRLAFHDHHVDYSININGANGVADTHPDTRIAETYAYGTYDRVGASRPVKIYPLQWFNGNGNNWVIKYSEVSNANVNSSRNRKMFRYADLLLMLAEIENERGNTQNAIDFIEPVLFRADNTGTLFDNIGVVGSTPKGEVRDRILKERIYELVGEGHEWFDLRRQYNDAGVSFLKIRMDRREVLMTPHKYVAAGPNPDSDQFDFKGVTKYNDNAYQFDLTGITADENLITKNMRFPIPLLEISGNNAVDQSDQNIGY
tara:strand:- start:4981 stop:6702 length:1722 start_codon:yes stop_codon:yes gene_type:complete